MIRKTLAAILLALAMVISALSIPAVAAAEGNWSTATLSDAVETVLQIGDSGEYTPDDSMTRAQMAALLNIVFGATDKAPLEDYADVEADAWYFDDMAKAVQMGTFADTGDQLYPLDHISRQDVYVALARLFKLHDGDTSCLDDFEDKDAVSPEAVGAASALISAGYVDGSEGKLDPQADTTIAEFARILDAMIQGYITEAGAYAEVPDGNIMINAPDVTLKDVTVSGDLIIGDGVGDGDVTLENVNVTGRVVVRGGGVNSIKVTGSSSLGKIIVARVNGKVRVFAEDGTEIGEITADGQDDVIVEGNVESIIVLAENVTVTAINANFGIGKVEGANSRIVVGAGSTAETIELSAPNASAEVSGNVTVIAANGEGATVEGDGNVGSVKANANNVTVTTPDTDVTAAPGTTGIKAGEHDVPAGSTVNTTANPKPSIASVSPAAGPLSGGNQVTIHGRRLTGATSVAFGGTTAKFTVVSSVQITATVPKGTAGTVDVFVETAEGKATAKAVYTYVPAPAISYIFPAAGPDAGGTTVTITGTNLSNATSVRFGGTAAASFAVDSDTQITAATPAGAAGEADVEVTTAGGTATASDAYIYVPAPAISDVSPAAGPEVGGVTVTISGENLESAWSVTFGGSEATSFTVDSDERITAVAPAGIAGAADVEVATVGGLATAADAYTYVPLPGISSVTPAEGPEMGGMAVTISGAYLGNATSVCFGGEPATSFTINSDAQISATAPAGTAGTVDVEVSTAGGTATAVDAYTYVAAPTISSVSPVAGPDVGGTAVSIFGTNLTNATSVTFGGAAAASYTIDSDVKITATTPAGTAGAADVSVVTVGGTATAAAAYAFVSAPTISSVSPAAGPVAGGATVTVAGANLTDATNVTFGGVPAASYTIDSDSEITAVTPAGAAGIVDVEVTTAGGTATASGAYTYAFAPILSNVSPVAGPELGGATVTVTGANLAGATNVTFGGNAATSFAIDSDTQITATTPAGTVGAADVEVVTAGGTATAAGAYTYVAAPAISSVSPASGPDAGGMVVALSGTNFTSATSVTFGGTPAITFVVNSDTQIVAVAPAGTGTADVSVSTVGGTATAAGAYTFVPAPTITSVTPAAGPDVGGETVTITGANLTGTTSVTFGVVPATSFTVDSDTQITATTPAGVGTVAVSVTTVGGTANAANAYTYVPCPGIAFVNPVAGPEAGGETVAILGMNFTGATSVTFDGVPATSFTVDSDMQITAVTPAGTAGAVVVSVTTAGGTATAVGGYTYVPAPTISTVLPNMGPEVGSAMVTIIGTNLMSATSVRFGAVPAIAFTVNSDTQITAIAGPGTGTVDISVATAGGTATAGGAFVYIPVPAITSVSPSAGPEMGGTTVTITGANLSGATHVHFGPVPAIAFTVDSDTQVTAIAPAGFGTMDVTVVTAGGPATSVGTYTYVPAPIIASLSPAAGPEAGGTAVGINGANLAGATSVTFGGVPAASFTVVSYMQIIATAPTGTGAVDVTVATAGGSASAPGTYAYVPTPTVSDVSPAAGSVAGGETVTIIGTNLTGTTSVTFGGVPAISFTVHSGTQITAVAPMGVPETADVSVTTAGGTATAADAYTYYPIPLTAFILPAAGPDAGGAMVTITGLNLTGTTSVTIGGAPAIFAVDSDTQITAITPAGTPGMANIVVTTPGGVSSLNGFYTYVSAPTIASISPAAGPEVGGLVIITGTSFTTATSVTFDGVSATSFTVNSDTQITATTPVGTGTVDISIVTAGGTAIAAGAYTYVPAPEITSVSPAQGPEVGGAAVTITGENLTGATYVLFGATPAASFTANSDTQILAVTPPGTGTVDVSISTAGGTATAADAHTYAPMPTISSLTPTAGPEAGGTTVTITGTGFTYTMAVAIDGSEAAFTVISDTEITAVTPAASAGTVDVEVITAGGTATAVGAYSYVLGPSISAVFPNAGPEAGGVAVTIVGMNFSTATNVTFGGIAATSFMVDSETQITATTPAGVAGLADVVVATAGGTATAANAYAYVSVPTIASVSPAAGQEVGGTIVTVTGTNFTGATAVTFGGTPATSFTVSSATQIQATAPAGTGTVDVAVATAGGEATSAGAYTYVPAPTIASVSPTAGSEAGGTLVTITGTGLSGATSVTFGATPATSFTVSSATQIQATAPAGTGTVDVAVATAGGEATSAGAYTYVPVPTIISISPTSGLEAGGTAVTIIGTYLADATSVTFAGTAATVTANSDTQITVTAPAGTPGEADVVVTTAGGQATAVGAYTYLPTPAPAITSVSPTEGYHVGGTTVVITGTDLTGATSVTFGGTAATFTVDSATQITATPPAGTAGVVDISVTTAGGTATAAGAYTYVALPAPTISSVTPTVGPVAGGTTVVITGTDFAHVLSVTFGGAPTTYTVDSNTQITATTPEGIAGAAYVSVTTAVGTATSMGAYTYVAAPTISSVSPSSGSHLGGNAVTIAGTGFTNATSVKFGGVDAWTFTVDSNWQITATAPARSVGTVDVAVTTPGGTGTCAGAYHYDGPVSITSIDASDTSCIIISGTGFTGVLDVQFNGVSAYCVEVSDNEVWVEMPLEVMPGSVSVTVTSPLGTATGSFTYSIK